MILADAMEALAGSTATHGKSTCAAGVNLEAELAQDPCSRLAPPELDAVRAQASDLRAQFAEYEQPPFHSDSR